MIISLIVAISKNYVIGKDNQIPWRIKGEQKRFKDLTIGKSIIMGRKTYESIGKPLKDRRTIMISNTKSIDEKNCMTVKSLDEAFKMTKNEEEVFIVGGSQLYREVLPIVDKMYITIIDKTYIGNIYFPKFNKDEFNITYSERIDGEIPYTYYTFIKK
ncbi:MAG: dihydrofolate reductase [Clostridiales bacterium]